MLLIGTRILKKKVKKASKQKDERKKKKKSRYGEKGRRLAMVRSIH